MGKLVYELDAVFDENGRAELRLPDIPAGRHHLSVEIESQATNGQRATELTSEGSGQFTIEVTGKHFKWSVWDWAGYPPDHVFTREDFYDEDD